MPEAPCRKTMSSNQLNRAAILRRRHILNVAEDGATLAPPQSEASIFISNQNKIVSKSAEKQLHTWYKQKAIVLDQLNRQQNIMYDKLVRLNRLKTQTPTRSAPKDSRIYSAPHLMTGGVQNLMRHSSNLSNTSGTVGIKQNGACSRPASADSYNTAFNRTIKPGNKSYSNIAWSEKPPQKVRLSQNHDAVKTSSETEKNDNKNIYNIENGTDIVENKISKSKKVLFGSGPSGAREIPNRGCSVVTIVSLDNETLPLSSESPVLNKSRTVKNTSPDYSKYLPKPAELTYEGNSKTITKNNVTASENTILLQDKLQSCNSPRLDARQKPHTNALNRSHRQEISTQKSDTRPFQKTLNEKCGFKSNNHSGGAIDSSEQSCKNSNLTVPYPSTVPNTSTKHRTALAILREKKQQSLNKPFTNYRLDKSQKIIPTDFPYRRRTFAVMNDNAEAIQETFMEKERDTGRSNIERYLTLCDNIGKLEDYNPLDDIRRKPQSNDDAELSDKHDEIGSALKTWRAAYHQKEVAEALRHLDPNSPEALKFCRYLRQKSLIRTNETYI